MDNKVELGGSGAWASMETWLTPKILFCILNITIGTIFVSSKFKLRSKQRQDDVVEHMVRAPSFLQRVGSFDFSFFPNPHTTHYQETAPPLHVLHAPAPQLQRSPSLLDRVRNLDFSILPQNPPPAAAAELIDAPVVPQLTRVPSMLERVKSIKLSLYSSHVTTDPVVSQTHPDPVTVKRSKTGQVKKMEKSASVKPSASSSEKEIEKVEKRRPATTRPAESASLVDEEVDARADDFINKFRQQLKLQRLDSLLRYRGSAPTK